MFITITGTKYFFGNDVFKVGQICFLEKEEENAVDDEAIAVFNIDGVKVGNVANSVYTVARGTRSAGYIHHIVEKNTKAKILFITKECIIAEVLKKDYSQE